MPTRKNNLKTNKSKKPSKRTKRVQKKSNIPRMSSTPKVSKAGVEYLKCALATPDFSVGSFSGIPDEYSGRVVTKRYETVASLPAVTAGYDLWIMSSNIPGIAYFYGSKAAATPGAITWNPVVYPDTASLLPVAAQDTNFTHFRFASSQLEIVPLANEMTWAGSIQVFRGMITDAEVIIGAVTHRTLVGTDIINAVKPEGYQPFNRGAYSVARNTDPFYAFTPIRPDMELADLSQIATSGNAGTFLLTSVSGLNVGLPGFGSMETIVYKLPAYDSTKQPLNLRAWACVEYQVNATSVLYDYSHMSPDHDPIALALMQKFTKDMPACVAFFENDAFWQRFLNWVAEAAPLVAPTLGAYAPLALGVGGVAAGISALTMK